MTSLTVLRTERDGVEFFTVAATGESGMSQTGLARACGVSRQALIKIESALVTKSFSKGLKQSASKGLNPVTKTSPKALKPSVSKGFNPVTKAPSEWLQPFVGKDLNLSGSYEKNGGAVKVYTAEFCAAVIKHYAYSGSKVAQAFDSSLGVIGLTSYIQSQTGWLPEEFKAAPKEHDKLDRFLSLAMEWDRGVMMVVDDEGYEVDMSDSWTFFDAVVFSGFTVEEFIKFQDETVKLGLQKHSKSEKVKLFFERNPEIVERQKPHTENLERMLRLPKSPQLFRMTFFEEFGCEPDDIYWDLVQSALDSRIYEIGYADRAKRTEPLNPRIDSYMRGWNANTSASLVNK
jgi:hypothetical protein